jgi:hypothetical protein
MLRRPIRAGRTRAATGTDLARRVLELVCGWWRQFVASARGRATARVTTRTFAEGGKRETPGVGILQIPGRASTMTAPKTTTGVRLPDNSLPLTFARDRHPYGEKSRLQRDRARTAESGSNRGRHRRAQRPPAARPVPQKLNSACRSRWPAPIKAGPKRPVQSGCVRKAPIPRTPRRARCAVAALERREGVRGIGRTREAADISRPGAPVMGRPVALRRAYFRPSRPRPLLCDSLPSSRIGVGAPCPNLPSRCDQMSKVPPPPPPKPNPPAPRRPPPPAGPTGPGRPS